MIFFFFSLLLLLLDPAPPPPRPSRGVSEIHAVGGLRDDERYRARIFPRPMDDDDDDNE
jgi:hypothetical protein